MYEIDGVQNKKNNVFSARSRDGCGVRKEKKKASDCI